ncbi:P-loop containing nucleoside triphosphate hydrolase protein, partial [Mycena rebaudengoi]
MQRSTRLEQIIHHITFAASTINEIVHASEIPFLDVTAMLSSSILNCLQSVKSHKEVCFEMAERIHEVLCIIIRLCSSAETDGMLPPALLYDIARFSNTMEKIYTFVKAQGPKGRIKQLFKAINDASSLEACQDHLERSLIAFRISTGVTVSIAMTKMKAESQRFHEEIVALLKQHPELTNSEYSSTRSRSSSIHFGNSSGSLSMLPASPKIFHGRAHELQQALTILKTDEARLALLGTGGIGKTSLATALLHHGDIIAKYAQRYFVTCHSAATCGDLITNIASHIGLERGQHMVKKIIGYFKNGSAALLILDNLETLWEPITSRRDVEEFLSLLTDVPHLALIITMRGAERPNRVKWTRPFIPPLEPLSDSAAHQTFIEIADEIHEEIGIQKLLALTDNLPLAVSLIASVAAHDGCDNTLLHWKTESTRLLSDGCDKRSSLDISIIISLCSSRLTPAGQDLLSILSMLPDGLSDADLVQIQFPIHSILNAKATLLQTSLAYTANNRLKVLVPIREYVYRSLPPHVELRTAMNRFLRGLLNAWNITMSSAESDIVLQITKNLGNMNSILQDGLTTSYTDATDTLTSVAQLNKFYRLTRRGLCPPMSNALRCIHAWKNHPVCGQILCKRLLTSQYPTQICQ